VSPTISLKRAINFIKIVEYEIIKAESIFNKHQIFEIYFEVINKKLDFSKLFDFLNITSNSQLSLIYCFDNPDWLFSKKL